MDNNLNVYTKFNGINLFYLSRIMPGILQNYDYDLIKKGKDSESKELKSEKEALKILYRFLVDSYNPDMDKVIKNKREYEIEEIEIQEVKDQLEKYGFNCSLNDKYPTKISIDNKKNEKNEENNKYDSYQIKSHLGFKDQENFDKLLNILIMNIKKIIKEKKFPDDGLKIDEIITFCMKDVRKYFIKDKFNNDFDKIINSYSRYIIDTVKFYISSCYNNIDRDKLFNCPDDKICISIKSNNNITDMLMRNLNRYFYDKEKNDIDILGLIKNEINSTTNKIKNYSRIESLMKKKPNFFNKYKKIYLENKIIDFVGKLKDDQIPDSFKKYINKESNSINPRIQSKLNTKTKNYDEFIKLVYKKHQLESDKKIIEKNMNIDLNSKMNKERYISIFSELYPIYCRYLNKLDPELNLKVADYSGTQKKVNNNMRELDTNFRRDDLRKTMPEYFLYSNYELYDTWIEELKKIEDKEGTIDHIIKLLKEAKNDDKLNLCLLFRYLNDSNIKEKTFICNLRSKINNWVIEYIRDLNNIEGCFSVIDGLFGSDFEENIKNWIESENMKKVHDQIRAKSKNYDNIIGEILFNKLDDLWKKKKEQILKEQALGEKNNLYERLQ